MKTLQQLEAEKNDLENRLESIESEIRQINKVNSHGSFGVIYDIPTVRITQYPVFLYDPKTMEISTSDDENTCVAHVQIYVFDSIEEMMNRISGARRVFIFDGTVSTFLAPQIENIVPQVRFIMRAVIKD